MASYERLVQGPKESQASYIARLLAQNEQIAKDNAALEAKKAGVLRIKLSEAKEERAPGTNGAADKGQKATKTTGALLIYGFNKMPFFMWHSQAVRLKNEVFNEGGLFDQFCADPANKDRIVYGSKAEQEAAAAAKKAA